MLLQETYFKYKEINRVKEKKMEKDISCLNKPK